MIRKSFARLFKKPEVRDPEIVNLEEVCKQTINDIKNAHKGIQEHLDEDLIDCYAYLIKSLESKLKSNLKALKSKMQEVV